MLDRPAQAALESTGMMDNTMERTLILVKPDAVQRQLHRAVAQVGLHLAYPLFGRGTPARARE